MNEEIAALISDRLTKLEQRQKRASRWLVLMGMAAFLQVLMIVYLVVPFGGRAKHLLSLQAGRIEVIDQDGTVRGQLIADRDQTYLVISDRRENPRIVLRDNEVGFATLEFSERINNETTMTLFAGSRRSFLKLQDPKIRRYINVQAGEGEMGLRQFDDRGQQLP